MGDGGGLAIGAAAGEAIPIRTISGFRDRAVPRYQRNRGFSVIALDNPKNAINIGSALRGANVYGVSMVIIGGARPKRMRAATDTTSAWAHIPVVHVDDIFDAIPFDCVPVAVDLIEGSVPLPRYAHLPRACYIFGAEDATLGKRITDRCAHSVVIPGRACMNLAATVNVVLYDRMVKLCEWTEAHQAPLAAGLSATVLP